MEEGPLRSLSSGSTAPNMSSSSVRRRLRSIWIRCTSAFACSVPVPVWRFEENRATDRRRGGYAVRPDVAVEWCTVSLSIQRWLRRGLSGAAVQQRQQPAAHPSGKARVLLVDDDEICNLANEVASNEPTTTPSALRRVRALDLLHDNPLTSFCSTSTCGHERHRGVPKAALHSSSQGHTGHLCHASCRLPEPRQSVLSGGDDLIAKPIAPLELIVKATVFL